MIIAGIDEAGYGPVLGPLVIGCCALSYDPPSAESAEAAGEVDFWKLLARVVARSRSRNGRTLHVNDSKKVYTPAVGLAELEKSVLAFASAAHGPAASLDALLAAVDPDAAPLLAAQMWYAAGESDAFPAVADAASTRIAANALGVEQKRAGVAVVRYAARVIPERELNRIMAATRNKSSASFSIIAQFIDGLLRDYAGNGLTIVCDRQGGREHYAPVLRLMFPDWALAIVNETEAAAEYELAGGGNVVRILFAEKSEQKHMPVALASMLAKYLRESLMARFNAWWRQHDATLEPTAGYWTDGQRFLEQVATLRNSLGIADADLIRSR